MPLCNFLAFSNQVTLVTTFSAQRTSYHAHELWVIWGCRSEYKQVIACLEHVQQKGDQHINVQAALVQAGKQTNR